MCSHVFSSQRQKNTIPPIALVVKAGKQTLTLPIRNIRTTIHILCTGPCSILMCGRLSKCCNEGTEATGALASAGHVPNTVLWIKSNILISYSTISSGSSITAGPVNAYVTCITQVVIIMALRIGAILALAGALVLVIFGNTIYATLTSFKCIAYALVTAFVLRTALAIAAGLVNVTYCAISIITTFLRGRIIAGQIVTATVALRTAVAITADPARETTAIKAAAGLIKIAHVTISISTTLLRGRVIALPILTATFPDAATAADARKYAATTDATLAPAAGLLGIVTTAVSTTGVAVGATLKLAAVFSGITASKKAASIAATVTTAALLPTGTRIHT
jgi:hypothetical protein